MSLTLDVSVKHNKKKYLNCVNHLDYCKKSCTILIIKKNPINKIKLNGIRSIHINILLNIMQQGESPAILIRLNGISIKLLAAPLWNFG